MGEAPLAAHVGPTGLEDSRSLMFHMERRGWRLRTNMEVFSKSIMKTFVAFAGCDGTFCSYELWREQTWWHILLWQIMRESRSHQRNNTTIISETSKSKSYSGEISSSKIWQEWLMSFTPFNRNTFKITIALCQSFTNITFSLQAVVKTQILIIKTLKTPLQRSSTIVVKLANVSTVFVVALLGAFVTSSSGRTQVPRHNASHVRSKLLGPGVVVCGFMAVNANLTVQNCFVFKKSL